MPEINKTTTITGQYYSSTRGPLDAKLTPADSYAELQDLARIPVAQRYVGLTVTVLNAGEGGTPVEYWLVGGRTNAAWKIKAGIPDSTKTQDTSKPTEMHFHFEDKVNTLVASADNVNFK